MSDRIPGTTYDNPIMYRGWRIYNGPAYTPHDRIEFAHDDYDGPEDGRCGHASSEADARQQIDDIEAEAAIEGLEPVERPYEEGER